MRALLATFLLATALQAVPAAADVLIHVDKATQSMDVSVDGRTLHSWPVSTGKAGHDTPAVSARPQRMEAVHFSKEWDDAPMPHAIFFTDKGHAIHGSGHVRNLGNPASHGCVRLAPANAATLFALVKAEGPSRTRIVVDGEAPVAAAAPVARVRRAPARPRFDPYDAPAEEAGARYDYGSRYGYGYGRDVEYVPSRSARTYERGYGSGYGRGYDYDGY